MRYINIVPGRGVRFLKSESVLESRVRRAAIRGYAGGANIALCENNPRR